MCAADALQNSPDLFTVSKLPPVSEAPTGGERERNNNVTREAINTLHKHKTGIYCFII